MTTAQERSNLEIATALAAAAAEYTANAIPATEFVGHLVDCMSEDIVFRSTYTPSWEPLRPLFADCRGIDEIIMFVDSAPIEATYGAPNPLGR